MKRWSWVCLALAAALAHGQDVLTIDEALASARENNGDVRSAFLSVRAAEQDVKSARADFLPLDFGQLHDAGNVQQTLQHEKQRHGYQS